MTPRPSRYVGLTAITVTLGLVYGVWNTYSIVLVALLDEFGWSRSVLAGAFSLMLIVHGAASPVAGFVCRRVAPRLLMAAGGTLLAVALVVVSLVSTPVAFYLAYGVGAALPLAVCGWIPSMVQVQRDFHDRLGLAIGVASAGIGVGIFFVVPLFQACIDQFGWRLAYRVLALACVSWIVPSSLLLHALSGAGAGRSPPRASSTAAAAPAMARHDGGRAPAVGRAGWRRSSALWLMLLLYFFGNFASQMLNTHHAAFFVGAGFSATSAATFVGAVGAVSIVGKIGGGWLSDRVDREIVYIAGIGCLVVGVCLLEVLPHVHAPWIPWGFAALFGIGYSVTSSLVPAMIGDRFGGPDFGAIVGMGMACGSIGAALGAWLAGWLFDLTGSYSIAFGIAAAAGATAAIAAWTARSARLAGTNRVAARDAPRPAA